MHHLLISSRPRATESNNQSNIWSQMRVDLACADVNYSGKMRFRLSIRPHNQCRWNVVFFYDVGCFILYVSPSAESQYDHNTTGNTVGSVALG